MTDVVIVGGGAAGSAAALSLARRGLSAVVIDRSRPSKERIGETLAPSVQRILAELGVSDRLQRDGHAPSYGMYSAWGSAELYSNDFLFHPYGAGWHIDRRRFDKMLAEAAREAGVVFYQDARLGSCHETEAGWEMEVREDGQLFRLTARVLMDATGRSAVIARRMGAKRIAFDQMIGIARFYRVTPGAAAPPDSFTLVETVPQGWWYSAFLPGDRLVAVCFTDPELRHEVEAAPHTQARIGGYAPVSDPIVHLANSSCLDCVAGARWLAVGDANSAWDPLSSQGIVKALRSGVDAADTIAEYLSGDTDAMVRYADRAKVSFERYLNVRRHYYRREMRWPESIFWKRQHGLGLPGI